ncbi:prolyl oligopeptidase family serine peptidase [Pirellulaceae bacterium]|nr:prolyl oligopeptidase family serine peptidase [Pirellulaceae bacterium]
MMNQNLKKLFLFSLLFMSLHNATSNSSIAQDVVWKYPSAKKIEQVDDYFGQKVADPYRWLENDVREDNEVANWVEKQNKLTFGYLKDLPYREKIEGRITELWNYEKYGLPRKAGDKYYYSKNDGLQNQSVVYQMDSLNGDPSVLLDPNKWSADGTIALAGMTFSDDGKFMAYGVQDGGSDWRTWKVMNALTGEILNDELNWIKFSGVSWSADNKGFFYGRYDEPEEGAKFQSLNKNMKVYYHLVGTKQSADKLIHSDSANPDWGFQTSATEDGKYLVVTIWKGTANKYRVNYKDLSDDANPIKELITTFDNEFSFIGNRDSWFYFLSDWKAPKKSVIAIDVKNPLRENWKVIVPEADEALDSAGLVGGKLVADYLKDAKTQIRIFDLDGKFVREVKFPGIGTASGFGGKQKQTETFYSFSSFATPPTIYRYDMDSGESKVVRRAKVAFDPQDYVVSQVFYESKDGTKIPMFIAHRRDIKLDGTNPTLLYAYGGFSISLTPGFSISRLQWMEMGGVFAMPNLRGGGEYGEPWHLAGTKTQKQNVFDDFIAAAEYLIERKYTSKKHLAIQGGSNGGLLVGACMTQRPDLYAACLPAVGVMDMLRFHKFTAGRFWVDDYGCSETSQEEFRALAAYSPYHNIKDQTEYPPTLVTTADTDDRVVPGHSFKFAARLQEAQTGPNPTLIRIETRAGHGAGKPTSKIIEEIADQWAFLIKHLGANPKFDK